MISSGCFYCERTPAGANQFPPHCLFALMIRQLLARGTQVVLHGRSLRWNFIGNLGGRPMPGSGRPLDGDESVA
jgi:hypothetical protein